MSNTVRRLAFIDLLKASAAQLVVLHHLAFYGPMSDAARELLPGLVDWFSEYARIAVQVFLVVGGFLAARGLAPEGRLRSGLTPLPLILQRYRRLAGPYLVALLVAIVGAWLADRWMDHESIPAAPGWTQFAAHALLLHNILGVEALSAGVWYVAIDFQLFALLVLLLWLGARRRYLGMALVLGLALASLFHFNRDAEWDIWAPYFFGSYALGVLAWWGSDPRWSGRGRSLMLALVFGAALLALLLDFRLRIAVALGVAACLVLARSGGILERWPDWRPVTFLARISYSTFLVHFPVCLVVNSLFVRYGGEDPWLNLMGMGLAWAASLGAGTLFHRWVETARLPALHLPRPAAAD